MPWNGWRHCAPKAAAQKAPKVAETKAPEPKGAPEVKKKKSKPKSG